jgi:hypothetical protein
MNLTIRHRLFLSNLAAVFLAAVVTRAAGPGSANRQPVLRRPAATPLIDR